MIWIFWLVMALVVAVIAGTKGRNGFGWFFYGLAIWPVALAHIAFARRLDGPVPVAVVPGPAPAVQTPPPASWVGGDPDPRTLPPAPAGQQWKRHTKFALPIRGVTKDNSDGTPRQEIIAAIRPGDYLAVLPEPDNAFDKHALRFMTVDGQGRAQACVGYVPAERAEEFAKRQAAGSGLQAFVETIERVEGAVPFLAPRIRFEIWELEAKAPPLPLRELPPIEQIPAPSGGVPKPSNAPLVGVVALIAVLLGAVWVVGRSQEASSPAIAAAPASAIPVSAPAAPADPAHPATTIGKRPLSKAEIFELQTLLWRLGFDVGPADGIAGPKTLAAMRTLEIRADWRPQAQPVFAHLDWARFQTRTAR